MTLQFTPHLSDHRATPERRAELMADPGFGKVFTDHMVTATWTSAKGWHDGAVVPFGPISLSPAAAVLHYAQEIFEGLKAYRHEDGSVWAFRPQANAGRLARSARRSGPVGLALSCSVNVRAVMPGTPFRFA